MYSEYLNAARKHLITCELIKKEISQIKQGPPSNKALQKNLLLNLYYLTGYVLECSIKYGIYTLVNFDPSACIKGLDEQGLNYNKHIKHHKFDRYAEHLISRTGGIKLVDDTNSINPEILQLYRTWDAEVRYWYKNIPHSLEKKITKPNLFKLLEYAQDTFVHVSKL
tara:strand:- start:3578 stop:4078 length:501 start_codon:yes stop_codon:yes gene_type:complete